MKRGLSGYSIVRNAIKLDYCIKLAIESLLPVCDEVVICDSDSTDGTREMLDEMASKEPRLRIVNRPWPNPINKPRWFVEWINDARQELRYDTQIMLDADEVLSEKAYPILSRNVSTGRCLWFRRNNFWKDARTVIPDGETCGHMVARFGPTKLWMPSDEPYGDGDSFHAGPEPTIRVLAIHSAELSIFHYGFLRKREAIFAKNRVNLMAFRGTWDARLSRAILHPEKDWQDFSPHIQPYIKYYGAHPKHCIPWLKERGAL